MNKLRRYVEEGSFYKSVVEDGSDIIFIVDYSGEIIGMLERLTPLGQPLIFRQATLSYDPICALQIEIG